MIGYYNYTVILTYISLFSSFIGIYHLFEQKFTIAVFCIMISGFCDMFDGAVARTCKTRSDDAKSFGIQIDSLCDLVCFGVFPALFTYTYTRVNCSEITIFSAIAGCILVLAALIRLGYYNVSELKRQSETESNREYFQGMPVTSVAIGLPFIYIFKDLLGGAFPYLLNALAVIVAFLFLLNFKMKKIHGKGIVVMAVIGAAMTVVLVLQFMNVLNF